MRVEYDRETCIGMFQCVDEWADFEKDVDAGKAHLVDGDPVEADWGDDVYAVEVPEGEEFEAEFAGRVCPVDAIRVFDDAGDRVV
ncbi:MAG: ferredoxin [Haloferacaceae archaeon]|jgi:ferredoxin